MKSNPLSTTGFLLASAASLGNVGFDVTAKKALNGNDFLRTTLKIRSLVALLLSVALLLLWFYTPVRPNVALYRDGLAGLLHGRVALVLFLSTGMVTASILLYYRSLQIAPLSLVAPLFGLTPVFLLITGYLFFRHLPSARVIVGVFCILLGSLLAYWRPSTPSAASVLAMFLREKGVRMMLGACVLLSITNLLDQWLVRQLDVLTYAWLYVVLCALFTGILVLIVKPAKASAQTSAKWFVVASAIDTCVLLLHFASLQYVDAVVTIAIKRSGMLLSVLAGSLLFKELHGAQRLAAALVVLMGVFIMYFDFRLWALCAMCGIAAIASGVAIFRARVSPEPDQAFQATLL